MLANSKKVIASVIPEIPTEANWPCHDALRNAIMTEKKCWPPKIKAELKPLLAKYL